MILQYKGFKNNWCYEEANIISWANVDVSFITEQYREKGTKYVEYRTTDKGTLGRDKYFLDLEYVKKLQDEVDTLIKHETNCADDIIYLIGDVRFQDMDKATVVTLKDKNKYVTYVFIDGVYILNNSGSTVQKIA